MNRRTPPRSLVRPVALLVALLAVVFCAALAPGRVAWAAPEQVTLSVPTTVPCAVLADGTVVAPDNWEIRSEVDSDAHLSAVSVSGAPEGVSFSASIGGDTLLSYSDGVASIGTAAVPARGSAGVSWGFGKLDAARCADVLKGAAAAPVTLCGVSMTFAAEPVAFAVYSEDDQSLDFYKRTVIPEVGTSFEGKTVTAVYTGFESKSYSAVGVDAGYDWYNWEHLTTDVPWFGLKDPVRSVEVVDSGIRPKSMALWFYRFASLSHCDLSALDASDVESLYAAFLLCKELRAVDLPAFSGKLATLRSAFAFDDKLEGIDLSSSDLSGARSFFHLASTSPNVSSVKFPTDCEIAPTDIDQMLLGCEKLKALDLSNWDASNITTALEPFAGLTSLEEVKLGDEWSWVGSESFLPTPSSAYIDGADGKWYDAATGDGYSPVLVPAHKAATYVARPGAYGTLFEDGSLIFTRGTSIDDLAATHGAVSGGPWHLDEENGVHSTYAAGRNGKYPWTAASVYGSVKSVSFRDAVSLRNANWLFYGLRARTIDATNLDMSRCTMAERMFAGCSQMTSLVGADSWDTSQVQSMFAMFDSTYSMPDYDFAKGWDVESVRGFSAMFCNDDNLESLDLASWNPKSLDPTFHSFDDGGSGSSPLFFITGRDVSSKLQSVTLGVDSSRYAVYLLNDSSLYGIGGDGKWYSSDGMGYEPGSIPAGKAGTYYAKKALAPQTFAVYSADDGSLQFYHRALAAQGDIVDGKTATEVYTGFEDKWFTFTADEWAATNTPWFEHAQNIRSVRIDDEGVRPSNIDMWFADLVNLESADISKLDDSRISSLQDAFFMCRSLKTLETGDLTFSNARSFSCAFQACYSLKSVDASSWDTRKAANLFGLFADCQSLAELKSGPNFRVDSATNLGRAFKNCKALASLDLSAWNPSACINMGGIFKGCSKLERIEGISNWNVSTVESMSVDGNGSADGAFENCPLLQADLSGWDVSSVTAKDNFNSGSPSVVLPLAWQAGAFAVYSADDGSLDFYNRNNVELPSAGDSFNGKAVTEVYTGFEEAEYSCTQGGSQFDAPYEEDSVIDTPWYGCRLDIAKVEVVDSGIRPKSLAYWFMNFQNCASFELSKLDTGRCTTMCRTFNKCKNLASLDLSAWNAASLDNMCEAFLDCQKLQSLDLSSWTTPRLANLHSTWNDCYELSDLHLGAGWSTSNVWRMGWTFDHCRKLASVSGLASWDTSSARDMQSTFGDCPLLSADLSAWSVSAVTNRENFASGSPSVVLPLAWQAKASATAEQSAALEPFAAIGEEEAAVDAAPAKQELDAMQSQDTPGTNDCAEEKDSDSASERSTWPPEVICSQTTAEQSQ